MFSLRFLLAVLLCAVCGPLVRAHTAQENTMVVQRTGEGLEITAVLSPLSAAALLKGTDAGPLSKDTLPACLSALVSVLDQVCRLTDSEGKPIAPERTQLSVAAGGELSCFFQFPASLPSATLHVDLLSRIGAGFFFDVSDHTVTPVRRVLLMRGHTSANLTLPASPASTAAAASPASAAAPADATSPSP